MLKHTYRCFQTARHREIAYLNTVTLLSQVADFNVKRSYVLLILLDFI